MTPKDFISRTSLDLAVYRRVAIDDCVRAGLLPLVMEFFEAMALGATAGSRRKLDEADLYVGVLAHRHGDLEPGESASVTECEFQHARARGIDCLCFLAEPGHALSPEPESLGQAAAQQDFKRRVDARLIRATFTTPADLDVKLAQALLAQALLAWKQGDAKSCWPQPLLDAQVGVPGPATRWTHRARERRFVGRTVAWSSLQALCAAETLVAWQLVCGPGGAGKSRLVQEFCLALGQGWKAGFVVARQAFDWTAWMPNADTLLVLDDAAERIDEAQAILGAMARHTAPGHKLRLLLVEREADGDWLQQITGHRSGAPAMHALRWDQPPVALGPLSDDESWALAQEAAQAQQQLLPPREVWLPQLQRLDAERRPLFVALAVDALAAGRDIVDGSSASLLHDLIAPERQAWRVRGIGQPYQDLLVLATACGGLPDDVLAAPADPAWELPADLDFDAALYAAMGPGRRADGGLAPMKPDLIGEFLVLESLRGRSARTKAAHRARRSVPGPGTSAPRLGRCSSTGASTTSRCMAAPVRCCRHHRPVPKAAAGGRAWCRRRCTAMPRWGSCRPRSRRSGNCWPPTWRRPAPRWCAPACICCQRWRLPAGRMPPWNCWRRAQRGPMPLATPRPTSPTARSGC